MTISLRCVTDALEKSGKRFDFGMKALEQFKHRIHEWPLVFQTLYNLDVLRKNYPELLEEMRQVNSLFLLFFEIYNFYFLYNFIILIKTLIFQY